jgi:Ca-activated chloride channel family protein
MNFPTHKTTSAPLIAALVLGGSLLAATSADAAGLLKPNNASYADLKIKEHHVNVVIEDMYATTTVEQVFHNPNANDLEAIYSFPVPDKAAVGEFSYWVDGKPVTGEVIEKQRAREIYEQEKQQGREAAIVEKDQYKTFDISVFPVKANQDVKIKLVYLQNTHTDTGIGRYVYPLEDGGVDEQKLSFWDRNEVAEEQFSFNVKLRTSYPVDGLRMPKHPQAALNQINQHEWSAALLNASAVAHSEDDGISSQSPSKAAPAATLNQDILLYWRHKQDLPASVDMLAYKEPDQKKGTFKLTLTPGSDLPVMSQGRDWIFVLDISGSMHGKFTSLTEGIREGLGKLNPNDRFRIVLFNNQAHSFTKGFLPADQQTITETLKRLDQVQPGNGTNLYAGLKAGIDQLDSDRAAAMVLVTDGVANVGNTQKKQFLKLLENRDLRLFTFIMGNSANRPLLEEMTRVSNGFALSISNSDDIVGQLKLAQGKMAHSSMRDIQIEVDGVRSKELVKPRLSNSLYHGQQLTLFGHYYQPGEAQVRLTGIINGEKKTYTTRFTLPEVATDHPELERLWAFAAIEELNAEMDYLGAEADTEQAIVDTAVEYGLVTDYTSMIVVRDEVFKTLNIQRTNKLRVEKEDQARQHRNTATVTEQMNRVDKQQPMFAKQSDLNQSQQRQTVTTQRYGNGGGAVSPWLVIFIAASIVLIQLGRFSPKDKTEKR